MSDETIDKLKSIYQNISAENKNKFDQFEKERQELEKQKAREQEEKAKAEEEAKKKADEEKQIAEEQKVKEEAELAQQKEKEEINKRDKEQYGLTLDEFVEILNSYSDPPAEIESEEELENYYQKCFDEWKDDSKHFGWKQDEDGKWYYEQVLDQYEIEDRAVAAEYKDFLRYEEDYIDQYIVMVVKINSEPNGNEYICRGTIYYPESDMYFSNENTSIIRDKRYYDDTKWLYGDYLKIYGKFVGIETRSFVYEFTGAETEEDVPVFEVYYADIVQE